MALSELTISAKDGALALISGGLQYFTTTSGANAPGVIPLDGITGLPVSPATAAGVAAVATALGSPLQAGGIVIARTLLAAGVSRALTTTVTSADTALTVGINAVTIYARNSDAYFQIGNSAQTASATSVFIASGERLDLDVSGYATPHIAVIYGPSAAAAVLQITELS